MSNLKLFNQAITNPKTQDYLANVLSEKKASFVNNLTALVSNNKALQSCEPMSIMYAGIKATALNLPLDPNLGFAYVIPYNNRREGTSQAQFQIGYKGFIQLAIRSGQFKTINVTEVREGELKEFNLLTGEIEFQAVPNREEKPVIGYVSYFKLTNGFEKTLYSTTAEVEQHALKYSQTYGSRNEKVKASSKWATDFDAMAKKTVLKLILSKYAPLSVEMINAVQSDQGVIRADGSAEYVDNDSNIEEAVAEEISENANAQELDFATEGEDLQGREPRQTEGDGSENSDDELEF